MNKCFIVYAIQGNIKTALHAFVNRETAERYIVKITNPIQDEKLGVIGSPCKIFGISSVYIEELPILKG